MIRLDKKTQIMIEKSIYRKIDKNSKYLIHNNKKYSDIGYLEGDYFITLDKYKDFYFMGIIALKKTSNSNNLKNVFKKLLSKYKIVVFWEDNNFKIKSFVSRLIKRFGGEQHFINGLTITIFRKER